VVDGRITNGEGPHELRLSRSAESSSTYNPVSNAAVWMLDDTGRQEQLQADPQRPGVYQLLGRTVRGEPGRSYHVEIYLPEGSTYRSRPERMPSLAANTQLTKEFSVVKEPGEFNLLVDKNVVEVLAQITFPAVGPRQLLKWEVAEVYKLRPTEFPNPFGSIPPPCFIETNLETQNMLLFDGERSRVNELPRQRVLRRDIDHTFLEPHYFNVSLYSLTREAFTYWEQLNQVVNNVGSIFDTPPAPVRGNLYNVEDPQEQVLGYFQASAVQVSRLRVIRPEVPFFIPPYCEYNATRQPNQYAPVLHISINSRSSLCRWCCPKRPVRFPTAPPPEPGIR
jgi:hypothetical protein